MDIANAVVEGGRWVRIEGLQSPAGQKLNGKVGQVLNETPKEGRHPIQVDGMRDGKMIKETNFIDVPRGELVKVCRLPARGEGAVVDTEQPKCLLFPRDHSMFTECNPSGNSPVMNLVGVPLVVKKTKPYTDLSSWGATDNQKATYLMIEAASGFAPPQWQSNVGPVLVYRPGGLNLGYHDMWAIHSFLSKLLDRYGDGEMFDPATWLNSRKFQYIISQEPFVNLLNILDNDDDD